MAQEGLGTEACQKHLKVLPGFTEHYTKCIPVNLRV